MKKRNNPYDFKYVMERDNCSEEDAKRKVQEFKNKTSCSKEGFIKRYGDVEGLKKFEEFSKKSAHTVETFRKKYGENWKIQWEKYLKSKDSMSELFHKKKYGELWEEKMQERKLGVSVSLEMMIERYGENEGLKRFKEMNEKRSYSCSTEGLIQNHGIDNALKINESKSLKGSRNGMYGKPTPQGSGNGWSGWYKGIYFRSILELSYIKYLTDNQIEFKSAETKEYEVSYSFEGSDRTYKADFVINDEIIEIKPKRLINTKQNYFKFLAAKEKFGEKFKVLTEDNFPVITSIKELVESGEVKLIERYQKKYENYKH